jgi:hypothetical protein
MNETTKSLFNGNAAIYMRIASLAIQGLILAGVFWAGMTFVHKTDFDDYKIGQETKRAEEFKAMAQISETMARIDERLKNAERERK